VQVIEIDVWNLNGNWWVSHDLPYTDKLLPNNNNCPKSGQVNATRNQDLNSCIDGLHRWHGRHPTHPLVIVKLELKNGFYGGSPASLDALITKRLPRDLVFTPGDLMCRNPPTCTNTYAAPDEAARPGAGPPWRSFAASSCSSWWAVPRPRMSSGSRSSATRRADTRRHSSAGTAKLIFPSL
jgi:hypothetical protein